MPVASYWKLRRIAPRTLKVLVRRKGESHAIAAHEAGLAAKTQAYTAAFDAALAGGAAPEVTALAAAVTAWLPILTRDVDGFDATDFGGRPEVAEDVVDDARRLLERVRDHKDVHGAALAYRDQGVAALTAAIAAAESAARAREAGAPAAAKLAAARRAAGEALELELNDVRRTLSARLGRQDKDFGKLRPQRAHLADDDDDPTAPKPPRPVSPAAPGARPPV